LARPLFTEVGDLFSNQYGVKKILAKFRRVSAKNRETVMNKSTEKPFVEMLLAP
jgi:hypothetical protein